MQVIALQNLPKQSFNIALDNVLWNLALIETAGVMSVNITRAGEVVVSGARCVAGELLINYESDEGGLGNFMFLTDTGDLPWWQSFGSTQTLIYASQAELAAVRDGS